MNYARLPDNPIVTNLILQELIRTLLRKGVLTETELFALLKTAAEHADITGDDLTPQAAEDYVHQELLPAFPQP